MNNLFKFKPIAFTSSSQKEPYQAARQPDELSEPAKITFTDNFPDIKQALQNLNECSHVWLLYVFHHNLDQWKPLVQTPRSQNKIGVFATRAPYRPNPIGMTVVKLLEVHNNYILVGQNDLLDGTPILDIKPYHPESDKLTDAHIGWLETQAAKKYKVTISPFAETQLEFLEEKGLKEIKTFCLRQLEYDPLNKSKKRVQINPVSQGVHTLSYRTWRIDFIVTEDQVSVLSLYSGYTNEDLSDANDLYSDKDLHKLFLKAF